MGERLELGKCPSDCIFFGVFWHTGASSPHNHGVLMKDCPLLLGRRHLVGCVHDPGTHGRHDPGFWMDLVHVPRVMCSARYSMIMALR